MNKDRMTDQAFLQNEMYKDSARLNIRQFLHQAYSTNPLDWQLWVFDLLELGEGQEVLELGCGPGSLWIDTFNKVPDRISLTLTDYSSGMLRKARQNLSGKLADVQLAAVDAQQIPFPAAHFDVIIANHMFYHIPDNQAALKEIKRVLKPGGKFFAATNGDLHMRELWDAAVETIPDFSIRPSAGDFTLQNGAAQLEPYFENVRLLAYQDSLKVTNARHMVDYLLSTRYGEELKAHEADLLVYIEADIEKNGCYFIQKQSGVFVSY